jgi:hypothetical protein
MVAYLVYRVIPKPVMSAVRRLPAMYPVPKIPSVPAGETVVRSVYQMIPVPVMSAGLRPLAVSIAPWIPSVPELEMAVRLVGLQTPVRLVFAGRRLLVEFPVPKIPSVRVQRTDAAPVSAVSVKYLLPVVWLVPAGLIVQAPETAARSALKEPVPILTTICVNVTV